ncbi:MAG: hypothetical protein ABSE62_01280 [Chthoniobacteraceae bacterium]|jgi:hypothetical protein
MTKKRYKYKSRGTDKRLAPLICAALLSSRSLFSSLPADNDWWQVRTGAEQSLDLAAGNGLPNSPVTPDDTEPDSVAALAGASPSPAPQDPTAPDPAATDPALMDPVMSGSDAGAMDPDEQTPPAKPAQQTQEMPQAPEGTEPEQEPESPLLSSSTSTEEAANEVPLPENPQLLNPYSEWDYAQVESPMFLTDAVNDFAERPLYLTGNWSLKPHLSLGTYYDGNIFVRSNNTESDVITRIAPGVTLRLGDTDSMFYLTADYTTGINIYLNHSSLTDVDQDFNTQFQWSLPKTTIGVNLAYFNDTGSDIDATDRVRRQLYYAGITTHYLYGEKTSIDVNADYSRSDYDGLISSSQVEGQVFFNYDYSPKTELSAGATGGYVIVPGSNDQTFEQANLRATWRATGKVTAIGEVGCEVRQFLGGTGAGQVISPVFDLTAAWDVKEGTEVDVGLHRDYYVSAILQGQDYAATSVDATVRQRITDYVDVLFSAGYVNASYIATTEGVNATREDNYYYVRPAVQWKALSWLSVGIFYEYDQDLSGDQDADTFTRDMGGVDMAIIF